GRADVGGGDADGDLPGPPGADVDRGVHPARRAVARGRGLPRRAALRAGAGEHGGAPAGAGLAVALEGDPEGVLGDVVDVVDPAGGLGAGLAGGAVAGRAVLVEGEARTAEAHLLLARAAVDLGRPDREPH